MTSPALNAITRTRAQLAQQCRDAAHEYFGYASRALQAGNESTADHFLDLARRRLARAVELDGAK